MRALFLHRLRYLLLQWSGHADARPTEFAATLISADRPKAAGPEADSIGAAAGKTKALVDRIGRYQIKGRLGAGGLGEVFEAWDPLLSRAVAVKTLRLQLEPDLRAQLDDHILNEARAAAGLSHPNIVTVFDAGLCTPGVYIAMERLHGRDLRQALAQGWHPTALQAAQLARRVAEALAYAHGKGVVHCDVKPANIFLDHDNRPKVLDFGIARVAQDHQRPLGVGGVLDTGAHGAHDAPPEAEPLFGSPHYLAPEQLQQGQADARTDVRALGVVLYELLTGRKAFNGDSVEQVVNAVLFNHPAPAHELRGGVSRSLSAITAKAMAHEPERRYASAEEMARELREWCDRQAQAAARSPTSPSGKERRLTPAAKRRRGATGWALATGMLCAAAAGWLWWLPANKPAPLQPENLASKAEIVEGRVAVAPSAASPPLPATSMVTAAHIRPAAAVTALPARPALTEGQTQEPLARAGSGNNSKNSNNTKRASVNNSAPPASNKRPVSGDGVAAGKGAVLLSISPWGEVEVNGQPAGTTPPLSRLSLPAGRHTITVRNVDFPSYTTTVVVQADKPALVRHRFVQ